MKSMTGYGRATAADEQLEIAVEVTTINKKALEIYCSLPREWQALERELNETVRAHVQRGKVNVALQVKDIRTAGGLSFDAEAVKGTLAGLRRLAIEEQVAFEPTADTLLRLVSMLDTGGLLPEWESCLPLVQKTTQEALGGLVAMRETEGANLLADLCDRLEKMRQWSQTIATLCANTVPNYREALMQRLKQTELEIDLSDERILKEIALFADRVDISEELTRLQSHLEQFLEIMEKEAGAIGRKLDFLCQEIHREINTVGSKANNLEVTRIVIDCKNELERIREQVQNIE